MRRHIFTGAALVALTMWAGSLWALLPGDSGPLTGMLVVDGRPLVNSGGVQVLFKDEEGNVIMRPDIRTDSTGAFSVGIPKAIGVRPGEITITGSIPGGSRHFSVTSGFAVVSAPYALVAAEANKLVSDGDLILSDATLKCRNIEVTGSVQVTNSLSALRLRARDFPSNDVNVVEVRDLVLDGSNPNRGRLRWFGKEVVVMEGKAVESIVRAGANEIGWTFEWDGVSAGRFDAAVDRGRWLEPNVWTAPTDGFCRWVSASKVTGIPDGYAANLAGISIKHEDGGGLDVLPVGVVEGLHDPITMTFPVRKGDVVTIRYTVAVPRAQGLVHLHCSAEMSLRFRPIGLDK